MRYEAVLACREMADPAAVPSLVPLLEGDDTRTRIAVLEALGTLGGKVAEQTIVGYLDHPDAATQRAAALALQELRFSDTPLIADFD
jgi:HEAT repeat protein